MPATLLPVSGRRRRRMPNRTRSPINFVNLVDARRQIFPVQQAPNDRVARRQRLVSMSEVASLVIPSLLVVVGIDRQHQPLHQRCDGQRHLGTR